MKNLEQIRARNALACRSKNIRGVNDGEVIKKIPPLIMNNGLLAAAAFAFNDKQGFKEVFTEIAIHLSDPEIQLLPNGVNTLDAMVDHLTSKGSSQDLRNCTNEAMAWLNYARRFVTKS